MTYTYKNDLSSTLKDWLREVVTSKILTLFEPEGKSIPSVRIGQSRFISTKLAKLSDDSFWKFCKCYGRNTTLAGIWMFLEKDHRREYLVTTFGKRRGAERGRSSQFYGLHISYGVEHAVNFSPTCIHYFQKHISEIDNAEVLVCHNHRRNFLTDLLSQLIDWSPLPSNKDRETMYQFKYQGILKWLTSSSFHNIRFFLVENGRLREIQLPPADRVVSTLKRFTIHTSA